MSTSLLLSGLALLVSVLSAIYARRAASEAKQANHISSHNQKLAILESIRAFQAAFRVHGDAVEAAYFYSLLDAASKASLYFTRSVADHLSSYAEAAHRVLIARDGAWRLESANREVPREKWDEIYRLVDACREIEGSLLAELESQTQIAA